MKLKEGYKLAKCCHPSPGDPICGYYSHNMILIVHRQGCRNLNKVEQSRIVTLDFSEILETEVFVPEPDYEQLDEIDFMVLNHHRQMGVDYSHVVARSLNIAKQEAFDCHKKLRALKLLKRVEPLIIRYRKGIVDNKWIKHRNHTYYDLTSKGNDYLDYYLREKE